MGSEFPPQPRDVTSELVAAPSACFLNSFIPPVWRGMVADVILSIVASVIVPLIGAAIGALATGARAVALTRQSDCIVHIESRRRVSTDGH